VHAQLLPVDNNDPARPASDAGGPADDLSGLTADFPCFRIWREQTCDRIRYEVRSLHPGLNPHTVVTDDTGELRAALEPSRHVPCPRPHPPGQPPPARPPQAAAS
jgi:hypothetical protein